MIPNSDKLSDYLHYFFTAYLPQHRGVSLHTRLSYKHTFIQLLRYWKSRFPASHPRLDQFAVPLVLDFLTHLEKDLGNAASTRNTRLAALKSFFKMVALLEPRYENLCRQILLIPLKRSPRWPFDCLDQDEVDTLFAGVKTQTRDGYRDLCILRTLYNTGARASELCALRVGDLDFYQKRVLLQGKERKERLCPLWPETVNALRALLGVTPTSTADSVPVFRNHRGEPMTRFGVRYLLRRYAERARTAVPSLAAKRVHPHVWRHSSAVHLLRAGVDLVTISHWLGHASVETTNRYAAIDLETKRQALQRAGPVPGASESAVTAWRTDASILEWLEAL